MTITATSTKSCAVDMNTCMEKTEMMNEAFMPINNAFENKYIMVGGSIVRGRVVYGGQFPAHKYQKCVSRRLNVSNDSYDHVMSL